MLRKISQLPRQLGWGRVSVALSIAAFLLATFAFSDLASARPLLAYDAAVWNVSDRIGIRTGTPDANTVLDATRSGADTYIKSRNALLGAYFQTQSGVNWAGYNMLNPAGQTATYFGYRGSTQFRVFDSLANEDRILMDAAGTANGNIYLNPSNTGQVGIGTMTPSARLHVQTTSGDAVYGASSSQVGVRGYSGSSIGVVGQSASTGGSAAVAGYSTATTGANPGVRGDSASPNGYGVLGVAAATTGGGYGVYGWSISPSGRGVYGYASATTGTSYGVYGETYSPSGIGVFGWARATSGTTFAIEGRSDSPSGAGVFGWATATTGGAYGVTGQSNSTSGAGVFAYASASSGTTYGVYGTSYSTEGRGVTGWAAATTGTNYGVYGGSNSTSGYGVYFSGGLAGTGVKSAIVETQDAGWRTLYTIESPQNWFEDFGQASLAGGEAVVSIEPIFAQTVNLSQPYHVFLTPLGDCGLYVAEQTATSFTVRALNGATCDVGFSYRIVAPRLGYEDLRLAPAAAPEAVASAAAAAATVPEIE